MQSTHLCKNTKACELCELLFAEIPLTFMPFVLQCFDADRRGIRLVKVLSQFPKVLVAGLTWSNYGNMG